MMLKGKIGDTTYYVAQSRQLARQALNNSNYGDTASRTDVQQTRRVKWANLVNFYSGNKGWMKKAYENLAPGVSVFNRFIQLNINSADVALTKSEAQAKLWVPASYRVSQGSLPPLSGSFENEMPRLALTSEPPTGETATVADFSESIIANNPQFLNGDAIVCVVFNGVSAEPGSTTGMSGATYKYFEIVLDVEDTSSFREKYPEFLAEGAFLVNGNGDGADAAVWIHTRKSGGRLYVSTQDMFLNDVEMSTLQAWRAQAQLAKAIASYGESTNVPLAPGGAASGGSGNDSSTGGGSGSLE